MSNEQPSSLAVRQMRLVDQGLSMHAHLRDHAARASMAITISLLCTSAVSTAFAFAGDDSTVTLLGVEATRSTWLGVLSVILFCGSLADLVIDRRGAAQKHDSAVKLLFNVKAEYRDVASTARWAENQARLSELYDKVMDQLPPIPETAFNRLKAKHLRKVEISRLLSARPGITVRAAKRELRQQVSH